MKGDSYKVILTLETSNTEKRAIKTISHLLADTNSREDARDMFDLAIYAANEVLEAEYGHF